MDDVADRENFESDSGVCGAYVPRATSAETCEEGGYFGDLPPTVPRLHAESDRRRAWPVAEDCAPRSEAGARESAVPTPEPDYPGFIASVCDELKTFLLEKNEAYGNSVFEPINVFSKLPAIEGILIRIDDKIKRIRNGKSYPGDNDLKDLTGYLVLLMVLKEMESR